MRTLSLLLILAFLPAGGCSSASSHGAEVGVHSGLNENFESSGLDLDAFVERFEAETREIAQARDEIVKRLRLRSGMAVADVGAGTGLFLEPFAAAVGRSGRLYAVEISPVFYQHLEERIDAAGLEQAEVILCNSESAKLPPRSVDLVFVCDTYHHFEQPLSYADSLYTALRPGGSLVVVDFIRDEQSDEWVLNHVRAGAEVVIAEIESAGFRLVEEVDVPGLERNYFLRFRRD